MAEKITGTTEKTYDLSAQMGKIAGNIETLIVSNTAMFKKLSDDQAGKTERDQNFSEQQMNKFSTLFESLIEKVNTNISSNQDLITKKDETISSEIKQSFDVMNKANDKNAKKLDVHIMSFIKIATVVGVVVIVLLVAIIYYLNK